MDYLNKTLQKVEKWTNDATSVFPSNVLKLSKADESSSDGKTISDLWWDLKRIVDLANENPETSFLAFPAVDAYLERLPWLYPITLHQLQEDEGKIKNIIRGISELRKEIQSQDAYQTWDDIQKRIRDFAEQYQLQIPDINSLSEITPILLDAMQVPSKWIRQQWRTGADSTESPIIYWNMPRFRYISEFIDSLSFAKPCCIALGMIEPLVEDYEDPMKKAFGYTEELIRNTRTHFGEEALKDVHGGYAVIGVKRGENIWILRERLTWEHNPYGHRDFDYYGRRASYMPYQVTFKDSNVTPGLIVRNQPAWDLRSVLDKEQVIWLPMMARAVQQEFFDGPLPPVMKLTVDSRSVKILDASSAACTSLALVTHSINRPSAFGVDQWSLGDELLSHLGITDDTMRQIPVNLSPASVMVIDEYNEKIQMRVRKAAAMEAEKRMRELFVETEFPLRGNCGWLDDVRSGKLEITKMFREGVSRNINSILTMLNDPDNQIHHMTLVVVNGLVTGIDRYSKKKNIAKTTIDDGKPREYQRYCPQVWQFFPETLQGKRPPVAIHVVPKDAHDIALLMGIEFGQMDWRLRFWKCNSMIPKDEYKLSEQDPVLQMKNQYSESLRFRIDMAFGKREFKTMLPILATKYQTSNQEQENE